MATIMEVQPKVGVSKEGKSDSEIAYQLADMIMEKIALKIDIDNCHPTHLKVRNFIINFKLKDYFQNVISFFLFKTVYQ